MWVLFVNLSVVCLNNLPYEPFRSTVLPACSVPVSMSHSSLYQPVVTSAPCISPVRITTETFPSHIQNICYSNASIQSFSRHFSYVTKSGIFKNLTLRKKANRNFRGNLLKNHFRHLKLYSNPPS